MNSKKLGRFCTESNSTILSSSNKMMIKFRSDINFQGRGFKINYNTGKKIIFKQDFTINPNLLLKSDCHNTIKGFHGVIESPNFPYTYLRNLNCLWEIKVPSKNKINITFSHFLLEGNKQNCTAGYLEVSVNKKKFFKKLKIW